MGRINNHSSKTVEGRQSVLAPACQSQDLGLQSTKLFHCFGDADANHDDDDFKKHLSRHLQSCQATQVDRYQT